MLALLHEEQLNKDENHYPTLNNIYSQTEFQRHFVDLLAITTPSSVNIQSHISSLAQCFRHSKQTRCSLRISIADDHSQSTHVVMPLIETVLSLQQRILLPTIPPQILSTEQSSEHGSQNLPFYVNAAIRPWFYPLIHKQLTMLSPASQSDPSNLRRAAVHCIDDDGHFFHLLLEESSDANEAKRQDLTTIWESEIFIFCASDKHQLFDYVQAIKTYLIENTSSVLKDLAFTINSWSKRRIGKTLAIRAAFVSTSVEDLHYKLDKLLEYCLNIKVGDDIYCNDHSVTVDEIAQGKLAFVLPGLGAAYPDMLTDLCLHFPEVRAIFDFVDYLAIAAGSRSKPSEHIFPRRDQYAKPTAESPASLAMMDSAVIIVLMAEWAIFQLLLNLGITPDILLGCSTGEFAAITMSGSVNIINAAPLFYHLSTGVSKALPFNRLVNLRSLKINAALADIQKYLASYKNKIHLSADLSYEQLLVTGDKDSINTFAKTLEDNNISADFLPFAIPYHTPLVIDVVSPQNPDVLALQIDKPLIESWSCSLVDKYPSDPDAIRRISTELFSKPILFRNSIEALYAKGVRKFVEVGPRGNLAPIISETLKSSPHISIAANRADLSAITQLNHTLAALFVNDVYMDFSYLYTRRSPVLLPVFEHSINTAPVYDRLKTKQSLHHSNNFPSIEDFRKQLMQLEQQTITALQSHKSRHNINDSDLSEEISLPQIFSQFTNESFSGMVCRQIPEDKLPLDSDMIRRQADDILSPVELEIFQSFQQLSKRRQWLAGRIAIKEAVRQLLHNINSTELTNRDIEIGIQESGKIYINKIHADYPCPLISLTHKDKRVIAVAADSAIYSSIGIDLESTDPTDDDLARLVLSQQEQNYIHKWLPEERNFNFKKIWAAKEAAAKVLGFGLPDYLKNLSIVDTNKDMNHFSIEALVKHNDPVAAPIHGYSSTQTIEATTLKMPAYVANWQNTILAISFFKIRS